MFVCVRVRGTLHICHCPRLHIWTWASTQLLLRCSTCNSNDRPACPKSSLPICRARAHALAIKALQGVISGWNASPPDCDVFTPCCLLCKTGADLHCVRGQLQTPCSHLQIQLWTILHAVCGDSVSGGRGESGKILGSKKACNFFMHSARRRACVRVPTKQHNHSFMHKVYASARMLCPSWTLSGLRSLCIHCIRCLETGPALQAMNFLLGCTVPSLPLVLFSTCSCFPFQDFKLLPSVASALEYRSCC